MIALILSSRLFLSMLSIANITILPPSSAGIGNKFIMANDKERSPIMLKKEITPKLLK